MQDLIFYVAPYGTRGAVRDAANKNNITAPELTRGVSVRLRMRLFADRWSAQPYPVESLSGITWWSWFMDDDWDRGTVSKITSDGANITVRSVEETVNGSTATFTEVQIPLVDMDTEILRAWLGRDPVRGGLAGELIGYDVDGDPVFVLQIENFSVRNRIIPASGWSASRNSGSLGPDLFYHEIE